MHTVNDCNEYSDHCELADRFRDVADLSQCCCKIEKESTQDSALHCMKRKDLFNRDNNGQRICQKRTV